MADERKGGQSSRECEPAEVPAQLTLLYESEDGKLCLFEDGEGHLAAVCADRLA